MLQQHQTLVSPFRLGGDEEGEELSRAGEEQAHSLFSTVPLRAAAAAPNPLKVFLEAN